MKPGVKEIVPLTSLRGIAAVWVVVLHVVGNLHLSGFLGAPSGVAANLLRGGDLAVDVFFVLSGFVLGLTWRADQPVWAFWVRRVGRIFPLHLVVLAALAAGVAVMLRMGVGTRDATFFSFPALPAYATLTFVWFGLPVGWNGPTWSLSVEFAAYLLFPLIVAAATLVPTRARIPAVLVLAVLQPVVLAHFAFPTEGLGAMLRGGLGIVLGTTLLASAPGRLGQWPGLAALAVLALLAIGYPALAGFPIAFLVAGLAARQESGIARFLTIRPAAWLGKVSYSIYLLHAPLLIAAMQVLRRVPTFQTTPGLLVFALVYTVALAFAAELAWRTIEQPGIRSARALVARRINARRAG